MDKAAQAVLMAARYRIKETSLIGNEVLQPLDKAGNPTEIGAGTSYAFDGYPGGNLEPLNDEAHQAFELAAVADSARLAKLNAAYGDKTGIPDPAVFAAAVQAAVREEMAKAKAETDAVIAELRAQFGKATEAERAPVGDLNE